MLKNRVLINGSKKKVRSLFNGFSLKKIIQNFQSLKLIKSLVAVNYSKIWMWEIFSKFGVLIHRKNTKTKIACFCQTFVLIQNYSKFESSSVFRCQIRNLSPKLFQSSQSVLCSDSVKLRQRLKERKIISKSGVPEFHAVWRQSPLSESRKFFEMCAEFGGAERAASQNKLSSWGWWCILKRVRSELCVSERVLVSLSSASFHEWGKKQPRAVFIERVSLTNFSHLYSEVSLRAPHNESFLSDENF